MSEVGRDCIQSSANAFLRAKLFFGTKCDPLPRFYYILNMIHRSLLHFSMHERWSMDLQSG